MSCFYRGGKWIVGSRFLSLSSFRHCLFNGRKKAHQWAEKYWSNMSASYKLNIILTASFHNFGWKMEKWYATYSDIRALEAGWLWQPCLTDFGPLLSKIHTYFCCCKLYKKEEGINNHHQRTLMKWMTWQNALCVLDASSHICRWLFQPLDHLSN